MKRTLRESDAIDALNALRTPPSDPVPDRAVNASPERDHGASDVSQPVACVYTEASVRAGIDRAITTSIATPKMEAPDALAPRAMAIKFLVEAGVRHVLHQLTGTPKPVDLTTRSTKHVQEDWVNIGLTAADWPHIACAIETEYANLVADIRGRVITPSRMRRLEADAAPAAAAGPPATPTTRADIDAVEWLEAHIASAIVSASRIYEFTRARHYAAARGFHTAIAFRFSILDGGDEHFFATSTKSNKCTNKPIIYHGTKRPIAWRAGLHLAWTRAEALPAPRLHGADHRPTKRARADPPQLAPAHSEGMPRATAEERAEDQAPTTPAPAPVLPEDILRSMPLEDAAFDMFALERASHQPAVVLEVFSRAVARGAPVTDADTCAAIAKAFIAHRAVSEAMSSTGARALALVQNWEACGDDTAAVVRACVSEWGARADTRPVYESVLVGACRGAAEQRARVVHAMLSATLLL